MWICYNSYLIEKNKMEIELVEKFVSTQCSLTQNRSRAAVQRPKVSLWIKTQLLIKVEELSMSERSLPIN